MMMKIVGLILAVSLACAPALAEEPARVEARVCFIDDKPETYVFQFPSGGVVRLLNRDGASVTISESTVTAVLADTVLQFSSNSVQVLNNSTLAKWPCTDVTASILAVIKQLYSDANGLLFDAAVNSKIDSLQTQLSEIEKQRLVDAAAAEALREKLKSSDAELTAMTLALAQARDEIDVGTEAARLAAARTAALQALIDDLKGQDAQAELTAMTLALEDQRKKAEDTLTLLAAADAAQKDLANAMTQKQVLLAAAQDILSQKDLQLAQQARNVALLNQQLTALRTQLAQLQGMLDASAAKDSDNNVQISALGSQLNQALAQVAAEQRKRAELEALLKQPIQKISEQLSTCQSKLEACKSK